MKVILLKNIPGLGFAGEIKEVKNGYARNYLLPQKLARQAKRADLLNIERRKEKIEEEKKRLQELSKQIKEKLKSLEFEFRLKTSPTGTTYGAVNIAMILSALKEKGFDFEKKMIFLEKPLREIGEYDILVQLPNGEKTPIKIKIEPN